MATTFQIAANQRNAQKSTGPKTEEGKAKSRANALKDGLTGDGIVLTPEQEDAVSARMEAWRPEYQPQGETEQWVFRRMIVSTVQLDQIEAEQQKIRRELSDRARHSWEFDRILEAEQLGARLAANPAINQLKLLTTAQGCHWLRERWEALVIALEPAEDGQPGTWTEEQESLAIDLLGVAPELRIKGCRPWELTGNASALELACAQRDTLAERHEAMLELDARDRERAESGHASVGSHADRALWRLRRLDQACWRTFLWARKQLADNPRPAAAAAAPAPTPVPPPPPAPAPQEKRTQFQTGSILPPARTQSPGAARPASPIDPMSFDLTSIVTGLRRS